MDDFRCTWGISVKLMVNSQKNRYVYLEKKKDVRKH